MRELQHLLLTLLAPQVLADRGCKALRRQCAGLALADRGVA